MHVAVRPIVRAWETLQTAFVLDKDPAKELKRPLNCFKAWKVENTYQQINQQNCSFLYNKSGICEITTMDLTNATTIHTNPKLKTNQELADILGISDLQFFERITILTKVKTIWKKMTSDYSFKSKQKHTCLKEVFDNTKKGSRNYKKILMKNENLRNTPAETINTKWRISAKYDIETYMKKTFGFWKVSFLPANLQNLHLQIINHKLKLNDQLKHFARDKNNERVKGDCTFCTLRGIENPAEETYKHLFIECASSNSVITPIAEKYNIAMPDIEEEGEKIIYFWPSDDKWGEIRLNTFFLIYKAYINACRLRKELPTQVALDRYIKNETRKIASSNPCNEDLVENMLPFWMENEITREDTIEILQEYEGNEGKGRIMMDVNKRSIIVNTKLNLGYNFPSDSGRSGEMRLYDVKSGQKFKNKLTTPVLIRKPKK